MRIPGTRWFARLGAVALLLSIAAGAAQAAPATAKNAHSPKPNTVKKTGTIVYSDWQFPDTLNPFQTSLGVTAETTNSMFEGLVAFDNRARLIPDLLVSLPSIKNHEILNHGRTIVLKLRPRQYWSSGTEITNKDILFGWKMYMDPLTGPACQGSCDHIASITLKGKYEADLHMKDTYAPVLSQGLPPLWPHSWTRWGTTPHDAANALAQDSKFNWEDKSYWTNGPFQVAQFAMNDRIVLTPMKYYHIHSGPHLAKMIFSFYSSKPDLISGAATGKTDVTTDYTLADVKELQSHAGGKYKLIVTPSFVVEHLELNSDTTYNGKPNPLHDVRVREAMALSVDKIGLIASALGVPRKTANSIVAYTPFIVTKALVQMFGDKSINGAWDPEQKKYVTFSQKSVADAKKLIAQAGFGSSGVDLDFVTTSGNPVRQAEFGVLEQNWAQIGVRLHLTTYPPSIFLSDWDHNGPLHKGQFQVNMWAIATNPDPDSWLTVWDSRFIDRAKQIHSAINSNHAGIRDKLIDQGMRKGSGTLNTSQRRKWYFQVQTAMAKGAYWIPLYYRANIVTSGKHVKGDSGYPFSLGNTWNTYHWQFVGG